MFHRRVSIHFSLPGSGLGSWVSIEIEGFQDVLCNLKTILACTERALSNLNKKEAKK